MPVKGIKQTVAALKRYPIVIQEEVKIAVEQTIFDMTRKAQSLAPGPGDSLATKHGTQKNNTNIASFITFTILNNGFTGRMQLEGRASLLAIYIEFGTGASAAGYVPTLPKEFQQIARKYYINGKGTLIKQPFFLPAYFEEAPKLVTKIKKILKNTKL